MYGYILVVVHVDAVVFFRGFVSAAWNWAVRPRKEFQNAPRLLTLVVDATSSTKYICEPVNSAVRRVCCLIGCCNRCFQTVYRTISTCSRNSSKTFSFPISSHTSLLCVGPQSWVLNCSLKKENCDGKWWWQLKWPYWLRCTYRVLYYDADWSLRLNLHICCVLFAQGFIVVCFVS